MKRAFTCMLVALALGGAPAGALALSAVFSGDPIDPVSSLPYEIPAGAPLVQPGPDGVLGTADDVTTPGIVGDIDLVVRAGTLPGAAVIPVPALSTGRAALPVGVAGPPNAGGSEIPFTVYLSNGITSPSEPAGRLLAAADMDGIPVIVAAFADFDGDGRIGPTTQGSGGDAGRALQLRELEPVGRTAALFGGGIAHGSLAVRAGLPASRGGLMVALVAMALSGPFDPAFFDGAIPSGPGIATALPFLPQRDLNRLIRDRAVPAGPSTTLQRLIQFAAVPPPDRYALPLDGSSPSIDGALVTSQPAVRVRFRDGTAPQGGSVALDEVTFGTESPSPIGRWLLQPVDRFDNPADPPTGFLVHLHADPSLRLLSPFTARRGRPVPIRGANGVRVAARLAAGAADGTTGALRVERDGVAIASLRYAVAARAARLRPDVTVPSHDAATIQAAVDTATDRNQDGAIVIAVRAGVYPETIVVDRPLQLVGAGSAVTVLEGDGTGSVVTVTAAGALLRGLTAAGGATGFTLAGNGSRLDDSAAWRNLGAGVVLAAPAVDVWQSTALDNGGDGVSFGAGATGARCLDTLLQDNAGSGAGVQSTADAELRRNRVVGNAGGGLLLNGAGASVVDDNRSVLNLGTGVALFGAPGATVSANVCALNDEDGLHVESSDGILATANTLDDNKGHGIFLRRSADADFGAAAGLQPPPGDNSASGNRKGDVFVRPD